MTKMKRTVLLGLTCLTLLSGACKKTLDINSTRVVNEVNFWNGLEDSRAALMGIYGLTRAALADNNGHWIYGDVRKGVFDSPIRQDLKAVIRDDLTAEYPVINALSDWRRFFAVVNACNIFLERIHEVKEKDPRYTENNMTVDVAQVRFLRAFAYFYMVRIWGNVPFILTSREGTFENVAQSDGRAILEFVQQEMLRAAADLPYRYGENDIQQPGPYYNELSSRWDGTLVRKLSAYAVLAHVAAWQGKYADVTTYTKFVIDNMGKGNLSYNSTDYLTRRNGLFYSKNINQLLGFAFVYDHQDATFSGNIESLTLAAPVVSKSIPDIFIPKDSILSVFREPNDARFLIDTTGAVYSQAYFTNYSGKYPIFSKIKVILNGSTDPTFRIFSSAILFTRIEDVVLLQAEALAALGDKTGAINSLNIVRQLRYNVNSTGVVNNPNTNYVAYNEAVNGPILEAIFQERKKEFMGEGYRWYDLVRYNKIAQKDKKFLSLIEKGGIYWPVAKELLAQNPLLTQNPFWK